MGERRSGPEQRDPAEPGTGDGGEAGGRRAGPRREAGGLGDLLPESTGDEHDSSWDWREGVGDDEERYLRERPPHHGD